MSILGALATGRVAEFRELVIAADAERASQLLIGLCEEYPSLALIITLLQKGSIDQAIGNVGWFDAGLANTLRAHRPTLEAIALELRKRMEKQSC